MSQFFESILPQIYSCAGNTEILQADYYDVVEKYEKGLYELVDGNRLIVVVFSVQTDLWCVIL